MQQTIRHNKDNPAKAFLKRYRALMLRCDALDHAIAEAHERATNITVHLTPDKVQSSGAQERMAEDAIRALDAEQMLRETQEEAKAVLREILAAIRSVPDEMQRTVLTMRYVNGYDWLTIQEKICYEDRMPFVLHGRALEAVNRYLKSVQENAV